MLCDTSIHDKTDFILCTANKSRLRKVVQGRSTLHVDNKDMACDSIVFKYMSFARFTSIWYLGTKCKA